MSNLTVKLWKDKAYLNGDFQEIRRLAMELPGFRKFVNDSLLFELSGKNIEHLSTPEIVWIGEAKKFQNDYFKRKNREEQMRAMKEAATPEDAFEVMFKTKPFEHQRKAFMLSKDLEYYAYFMEMGTGKTKVVIDNIAYLYSINAIECAIILAPNGVHAQWINEQIPQHMPDWVDTHAAIYRAGVASAVRRVKEVHTEQSGLRIVAFNIESLSNKKGVEAIQSFLTKFKCIFVIDESTRIKSPSSMRTKNALKLAGLAAYRRIMSGAPVTKGYEDLYAQLKFMHPDVLGFTSFYTFRNYHCVMGGFEQKQIVGYRPNAIKELEKKIEAYSFRITKAECLDLPEKIYTKRFVELTKEQQEIYNALENELIIQINDIKIGDNYELAVTQLLRMQQVVCGHYPVLISGDEPEKRYNIKPIETKRIELLMECIEEAQGKVIVWSRFTFDLKAIAAALKVAKIGYVTYFGETDGQQREANINTFRNDPACKVFLAQPASGGTGLNLAVANTVIYFSNDFNADTRWQSEDRAHRIGQKNNVTYIDIVATGTIDEEILDSLRNKKNLADALLDNPRRFIKNGQQRAS